MDRKIKITIAKDAGYCFGVRDAVNLAYDAIDQFEKVYMLGDIVHNEKVVEDLHESGAQVISSLDEVEDDKPILFRAHGTENKTINEAQRKKLNIIDATCPLVHEIHDEVMALEKEGRQIFIIGDHGHDEVVAIADKVKNPIIIATPEEAKKLKKYKKAGVVSQSTQMIENAQNIINILMNKVFDLRFINTICYPTKRNHSQIKELAHKNDLMIIIGSFTSANSKRLAELSKNINSNTYQVGSYKDLKEEWFENILNVGISAGASTPDYLIDEVKNKIIDISKESDYE